MDSEDLPQTAYVLVPDKHVTSQQRRYNVAATSRRCSDVVTTLLIRCVFAGLEEAIVRTLASYQSIHTVVFAVRVYRVGLSVHSTNILYNSCMNCLI